MLDQAQSIRQGEELNQAAIDQWLRSQVQNLQGTLQIKQFHGGASNLTYLLSYDNQEFVLRRPPFGHKAKSAHDMGRECNIIQALKPHYTYVPEVVGHCQDEAVLGCEFFVMRRMVGIIPRKNMPKELQLDPDQTRQLCLTVLDKLIELHAIDPVQAGLEKFHKGAGYTQRQIGGWSKRYQAARTADATSFESVMQWLADHTPDDVKACVIHNDYRLDNVVLKQDDPQQVIGVLDWEMATIGDPLMDLGNSLAYWVQADDDPTFLMTRQQPTHIPGMLTRQEVVQYYSQQSGIPIEDFTFYEVYGLFRLAVIVQQIYYRYFHGQTKDPRFKDWVQLVNYMELRCQNRIQATQ